MVTQTLVMPPLCDSSKQFSFALLAAGSLSHADDMNFLASLERITVPDPFEDYSLMQDFASYPGPSLSDVLLPGTVDFPEAAVPEFPLDAYPLPSGIFPLAEECDPEGTASLVGSSMFPCQFKEAERVEMEAKLMSADGTAAV